MGLRPTKGDDKFPLQSLPDGRGSASGRDALPSRDRQGAIAAERIFNGANFWP